MGIVNFSIELIIDYLKDFDGRANYDEDVESSKIIDLIQDDFFISYANNKGKFFVKDRDLVCINLFI